MKDYAIEQKAKAYDELIAKLIKAKEDDMLNDERYCCVIDEIVPELAESEDEEIKKDIIRNLERYVKCIKDGYDAPSAKNFVVKEIEKQITWLEKQGIFSKKDVDDAYLKGISDAKNELEKQSKETKIEQAMREVEEKAEAFTEAHKGETSEEILAQTRGEKKINFTKIIGEPRKATGVLKEMWDEMKSDSCNGCVNRKGCVNCESGELKETELKSDNVEPKFHKGQWIVWQDKCYKVNYNGCGYELIDQNGLHTSLEYGTIDENAHLWTIADAKEGDVLYCKSESEIEFFVIYKCINEHNNVDSYFRYSSWDGFGVDIPSVLSAKYDTITPATKEQCNVLFEKMEEAGYEWDAEKKELKKLTQQEVTKTSDQVKGSAWSEEDECYMSECIGVIATKDAWSFEEKRKTKEWVKSLKQRIGG